MRLFFLAAIPLLISCSTSTVTYPNQIKTFTKGKCSIDVFYSKAATVEIGNIKEICHVEGSSAGSFDHSLDGAINKNLPALCRCGVDKAYISSHHRQTGMGIKGVTHVTLAGFKLSD